MRLTETEIRLAVNVAIEELTINGLVEHYGEIQRELVAALLEAAQRQHLRAVRRGVARPIRCPRCGGTRWVKRGTRSRQLKTSAGEFQFPLRQVSCRGCGRTWSPFVERLGLEPWQRATEELEEKLVGFVTELSYRKAHRFGKEAFGATLSPMGIWRRVQRRGREVELTGGEELPPWLEVDGTGVPVGAKKRGEPAVLALQVGARGQRDERGRRRKRLVGLAVGEWAGALPPELSPTLVVNDGGRDVRGAVANAYPEARTQRCEWHLVHSLDFALWDDEVGLDRRRRLQAELHGILFGPERSRGRRDRVRQWADGRLADHPGGEALVQRALGKICYPHSSPLRTTGHAERAMREMNRRVDVGARWTDRGLENLLRLRCARRLNPDDYARLWKEHDINLEIEVRVPRTSVSMN